MANRKGVNYGPDPIVPKEVSSDNRYWQGVKILEVNGFQGILGEWVVSRSHGTSGEQQSLSEAQNSMNQTFYLTNVVPPDPNINGGHWKRLEIWCRNLVRRKTHADEEK